MTEPLDLTHSWTVDDDTEPAPRRWRPALVAQVAVVLAVLVVTLITALVLRGNSGEDGLSVVKAASTSASSQDTLRATYELRLTGSGLDVSSKGDMGIDQTTKQTAGTIQAPGLGVLRMVATADTAYVQLPGGRVDESGRHWLSFRSPRGPAAVGAQDPLAMLVLVGNPDRVETVGRETLHDVDTTHYRVETDPKRIADAVTNNGGNITLPEGTLDNVSDATLDVWVDGKKLPRRLEMSFGMEEVKVSLVFEYLDYGEPVDVDIPASSDVAELASATELFARISAAPAQ